MHGTLNKSGYVRTKTSRVYGTNVPLFDCNQFVFQPYTARNSLQW